VGGEWEVEVDQYKGFYNPRKIINLKMGTAIFAETLDSFQYSTWFIHET
jgi:hypothetical protein